MLLYRNVTYVNRIQFVKMEFEDNPLIIKKTIYGGKQYRPFENGTKAFFHFQTRLCDNDKTVLDDSRKMGQGKPLELVIGKMFKLEVWEACIQKLAVDEVASFTVDKSLVMQYPFIAKTLRDVSGGQVYRATHCCAQTLQTKGVGFEDLDRFLKNPCNLEFIMELVKVEQPGEYEKQNWQLTEDERIQSIPLQKGKGNAFFSQKQYEKAADCYHEAISILEQLQLKEKPHDVEWTAFNVQKLPLLLNYAQCKFLVGDFYAAIEHCSTVVQFEPDNVKALYRRGKAHIGAWNPTEARADLQRASQLDQNLDTLIQKDLRMLDGMVKERDKEDKEKLRKMFAL